MKKFTKLALGALMLAGTATAVASTPADARVSVGIGIGGPAYGSAYPGYYGYSCDRYSRWYDPYRCGYYGYGPGPGYGYGYGYGPSVVFGFGGGFRGGFHGGGGFHHR